MLNSRDKELIRTETADFPMKLLTHALLNDNNRDRSHTN